MLEIPEARVIAKQAERLIIGKKIKSAVANYSPHKFAWFCGEPEEYNNKLSGKEIDNVAAFSGMIQIEAGNTKIVFGDGVSLKYCENEKEYPKKHQLLVIFEDLTALSGSIQMYGGLWCFENDDFQNPYYKIALKKPNPLSDEFNYDYFCSIIDSGEVQKLSVKALLATEQRIPGLGNGVLQDILWSAKLHPKRKTNSLTEQEKKFLFERIKLTLSEMVELGGRDTEKDFFGNPGRYITKMSKNNIENPCPVCGGKIIKENYMGGSIYYCENCQKL